MYWGFLALCHLKLLVRENTSAHLSQWRESMEQVEAGTEIFQSFHFPALPLKRMDQTTCTSVILMAGQKDVRWLLVLAASDKLCRALAVGATSVQMAWPVMIFRIVSVLNGISPRIAWNHHSLSIIIIIFFFFFFFIYSALKALHSILLPRSLDSLSILHSQCNFCTP